MQHDWLCLPAPAPAALSLPDRAVYSGHMQLLWDLLSPAWICQLGSGPRLSLQPICNWCHHLSVAPVAFLKPLIWQGRYTASRWASERKGRVQPECCECRLHFFSFKDQFSTSNCHWMVPKASLPAVCLLLLDAAYHRPCTWLSKMECVTLRDMGSLVVRWGRERIFISFPHLSRGSSASASAAMSRPDADI